MQALVSDGVMGEGGDVEVLDPGLGGPLLDLVAGEVKAALVLLVGHAPGAAHEDLLDARHGGLRLSRPARGN